MIFLKTANIILVYKNISIQAYKNTSRVNSWTSPLTRMAYACKDFVLSLGRDCFRQGEVVLSICGGEK